MFYLLGCLLNCLDYSVGRPVCFSPQLNRLVSCSVFSKIDIHDNTKIIENTQNWIELCFLESLHIKWKKPKLNCGIKATTELVLFS